MIEKIESAKILKLAQKNNLIITYMLDVIDNAEKFRVIDYENNLHYISSSVGCEKFYQYITNTVSDNILRFKALNMERSLKEMEIKFNLLNR